MKSRTLCILLILIPLSYRGTLAADSVSVTFRYDDPGKQQIRVFVPAVFNNWGSNVNGRIAIGDISQMSYDSSGQYWWKTVTLAAESTYAYKFHFHLDSSGATYQWISDPLNPLLDNSGYNNSLVTITEPQIFEPRLTRDGSGNITEIRAGIFSSAPIVSIRLIEDNDSTDVSSSYNNLRGIFIYPLPSPRTAKTVKLLATDNLNRSTTYQWLVPLPGSNLPWKNEVFYQIFPRSFFDSNGDSIGDFNGIAQKLDYLQQLGITGLWLNPVMLAHTYHNYFADSFDSTDTEFGSNADFTNLVKAVHTHGMKIFIDMEIQYISAFHQWYTSSYNNPSSPYSQYIWYNGANNTQPESFTLYSYDGQQIPCITLKMNTPALVAYQKQMWASWVDPNHDGVFDDGVDGFRIDHIMDNLDYKNENTNLFAGFWQPLFDTLRSINPNIFFLCEQADWGDYGSTTLTASGADAVFTIPLMFGIRTFDKATITSQISNTLSALPAGKFQFLILENHDVDRFASVAGGIPAREKLGAVLNLTLDGVPCIYYGQEIGMKGTKGNWGSDGNDIPNREAFKWYATRSGAGMALWYANTGPWWTNSSLHDYDGISVQEQQPDSTSLWNYYRKLIAARKSHIALRAGTYLPITNPTDSVLSYARQSVGDSAETVAIIVNLGNNPRTTTINFTQILGSINTSYAMIDLMGNRSFSPLTPTNGSSYQVTLGQNEAVIVRIASTTETFSMTTGWNLLSLPVDVADPREKSVFRNATSRAFAFTTNGYAVSDTLFPGYGYWVKFDSVQSVSIQGAASLTDTVSVYPGWNLIGSMSGPVAVSSIIAIPDSLNTSQFYFYSALGSYQTADTLLPWTGYWVKAHQAGKLILRNGATGKSLRIIPTTGLPPPPPTGEGMNTGREIPKNFSLDQNFPNPFNPTTRITYALPAAATVRLKIYNTLGQVLAVLVDGQESAGYKSIDWNAGNFPSGIYFCRLEANHFVAMKKLVVMK